MRLIDADELKEIYCAGCDNKHLCAENPACDTAWVLCSMPTIEAEPTFEQIEEYCRKRCLVVVDGALFNEMKSRWSAEPRKHGRWEKKGISIKGIEKEFCSECKTWSYGRNKAYCPNCGAKMDEAQP